MQELQPLYQSRVTEILPNTKRTQELRARQQAEINMKKQLEEKKLKELKDQEMQLKLKNMQDERKRKAEDEKKKEEQRRQQEEQQQINTLKGKFGHMINDLKNEQTPLEYTISGLNLLDAQIRILIQASMKNETLRCLSMQRKNIKDKDGFEIANCLKDNFHLEKVEVEGNQMGSESAVAFGELLKVNRCIRFIDLEYNDLTDNYTKFHGIHSICEGLKANKTLLSLVLNNTNLDGECSNALKEAMEVNTTLICLDIEGNKKMNIHDVRQIQDYIKRNKLIYDEERFREFIERKRMKREEDISSILLLKKEALDLVRDGINSRIASKKAQMEEEWNLKILEEDTKRQKEIAKLEKEAKLRQGKKKKKKKR